MRNRDVDRRITRGFIEWNQEWVTLIQNTRVKTLSGGWTNIVNGSRGPQVFTVIEQTGAGAPTVVDAADGKERTVSYVLVGDVGARIAIGDTFTRGGLKHIIAHVLPDNGYEVRALAVLHA